MMCGNYMGKLHVDQMWEPARRLQLGETHLHKRCDGQTPEEISINQDQMEKQTNYKPINKNFICHIASDRCAIFTL